MTLYVNLAELLGTRIEQGFYRPGDRLPSVRALSVEHGVSLSTVPTVRFRYWTSLTGVGQPDWSETARASGRARSTAAASSAVRRTVPRFNDG